MILHPHPWLSDTFPVALSVHTHATEERGRARFAPVNPFAPAEGGLLTTSYPPRRGVRRLCVCEGELSALPGPTLLP